MHQIINSILDTDLYKCTMQWFVLSQYPEVNVKYTFNNRNKNMKFNKDFIEELKKQIKMMEMLKLKDHEYDWIKNNLPFLPITYRQYLSAYRYNSNQVKISLDENYQLQLEIDGPWRDTILWEVPLMALISELYFKLIDTDWNYDGQIELANEKAKKLSDADCIFADFGTRRRRSVKTQDIIVEEMKKYNGFVGTSNINIAQIQNVKALGTQGHEIYMGMSVLEGLRHVNKLTLDKWREVYNGDLGTALPDTYGIDAFLKDFNLQHTKMWDSIRHDSGDPYKFIDKFVDHYKKINIDPLSKCIIFSDGLDVDTAIQLNNYCKGKIKCSFGLGTFLTNDFKNSLGEKSKPLNMVIKLKDVDGIPVVKLSDNPTKAIGDKDAIKVALWTFFNIPL